MIDDTERTRQRVEITKNGRRVAVLLAADDFDGLVETIAIIGETDEVRSINEGREQLKSGESFDLANVERDYVRHRPLVTSQPAGGANQADCSDPITSHL